MDVEFTYFWKQEYVRNQGSWGSSGIVEENAGKIRNVGLNFLFSSQSAHHCESPSSLGLALQQLAEAEYANASSWEEYFGLMKD